MTFEEIPDLPPVAVATGVAESAAPPPKRTRKSSPARTVDADTGELILSPVEEVQRATALVAQQGALVGQVALETKGYDVTRATPEARAALVDFYLVLREIADQLDARAKMIEFAWQRGMVELGASRLPLPDGRMVEMPEPAKTYRVDGPELRGDLLAFVKEGLVSQEDADEAIKVIVTYKPDHRVINKLERNAPAEVRESIATHRAEVPSLNGGRVRFPKPRA
jgi:hypothetical protein